MLVVIENGLLYRFFTIRGGKNSKKDRNETK